jgi:hypothetical protein
MGVSEWLEAWMVAWFAIQLPMGMMLGRYLRQASPLSLNAKPAEAAVTDRAHGWQGILQGRAAHAR